MHVVLVVDDSKTVRVALRSRLEQHGFEVVLADVFAQIPELIGRHKPSVLVLDVNMPALSGEQIGHHLRRHACQIPIVIYSSESSTRRDDVARSIGAASTVSKDAPLNELVGALHRAIRSAHP